MVIYIIVRAFINDRYYYFFKAIFNKKNPQDSLHSTQILKNPSIKVYAWSQQSSHWLYLCIFLFHCHFFARLTYFTCLLPSSSSFPHLSDAYWPYRICSRGSYFQCTNLLSLSAIYAQVCSIILSAWPAQWHWENKNIPPYKLTLITGTYLLKFFAQIYSTWFSALD